MKAFLKRQRKIIIVTSILVLGIVSGIGIAIYFPLLTTNFFANSNPTFQPLKPINEAEEKKQSLAYFYNELTTADDNQDWATLYKLVRQSVRDNVTEAQFSAYSSAQVEAMKIFSEETIINNIEVTGNSGLVDRTSITCLAKDCTGINRIEENAIKPYDFVNGKWQIPDPDPSERALKAANYAYEDSPKNTQTEMLKAYGWGSDNSSFAVRNWARSLDENLQELVRLETLIEKSKAERSRPIYNEAPAQIIQQEAPVVQQQTFPKSCTSNTLGTYTFTNCY